MTSITLTLKKESHSYLHRTIGAHKELLRKVKMPEAVRDELMKDISKINIILTDAEKAGKI